MKLIVKLINFFDQTIERTEVNRNGVRSQNERSERVSGCLIIWRFDFVCLRDTARYFRDCATTVYGFRMSAAMSFETL